MPNTKFAVNFDALPDFQRKEGVTTLLWEEQMKHRKEGSYLGAVIRYAIRAAILMQVAMTVDDKALAEVAWWATSAADTEKISGAGFYMACRWLSSFWRHSDELVAWFNDGQHKSRFTPSEQLLSALTR